MRPAWYSFSTNARANRRRRTSPFSLPFTAPHWPLQAPQDSIRKYHGVYADGPDALPARRLHCQIELGLLLANVEAHPVLTNTKEWADMTDEEQKWLARTMEVFAGMVDRMDENIGHNIEHIKRLAIVQYPPLAKARSANGVAKHDGGDVTVAFATVMDILPTILDLAGIPHPGPTFRNREVVPVKGNSWVQHLRGSNTRIHDKDYVVGWELFFHQAIRRGDYKAVFIPKPKGPERWQLYNVATDKGEIHDLAATEPAILDEREELEEGYALP
ncbi:hypothetical protein SEUCBS139899_003567 [Sporothrix eucalyptigena]